jgi:hypothetical protein
MPDSLHPLHPRQRGTFLFFFRFAWKNKGKCAYQISSAQISQKYHPKFFEKHCMYRIFVTGFNTQMHPVL